MAEYKTPGVYIKEQNAFSSSVVEAETAIPVFIGLTEKATDGTESLLDRPVRISSMAEYEKYFGKAKTHRFNVTLADKPGEGALSVKLGDKVLQAKLEGMLCTLYYHLVMFFANGGGACYVVSVGDYTSGSIDKDKITNTILPALRDVQDITLLVIPEAIWDEDSYGDIYTAMLSHCAENNRFAILDVPNDADVEDFRTKIGSNGLAYGAAYYPWLVTMALSDNDITEKVLRMDKAFETGNSKLDEFIKKEFENKDANGTVAEQARKDVHNALLMSLPAYKLLAKKVKDYLNLLSPSATMAGIYTMVDHSRGVWKAPANVSVSRVEKLSNPVNDKEQEDLNMPMNGKAINVLRAFPGEGIKVWLSPEKASRCGAHAPWTAIRKTGGISTCAAQ